MMDIDKVVEKVIDKIKVIILVDIVGVLFDYDVLKKVLKDINREDIMIVCDLVYFFGVKYKGNLVGL